MNITIPNMKGQLRPIIAKKLQRAVADVNVLQKHQVDRAFAHGGQPGEKWKPLWADTFVGKIPWKLQGALINAQSAYHKASAAKKPNAVKIANALLRIQKANAKLKPATSYRKGGIPLTDTGELAGSFHNGPATVDAATLTGKSTVYATRPDAVYHQEGFHTNGPNFIPLTLKARREHHPKGNPKDEGLELGIDYIMAWAGVHIPTRPMIDYDDAVNQQEIKDTVTRAFKRK